MLMRGDHDCRAGFARNLVPPSSLSALKFDITQSLIVHLKASSLFVHSTTRYLHAAGYLICN